MTTMTNEDKDKKEYELAVLVKSEEDLTGVTAFVRQHGISDMGNFTAKKIALAYVIEKQSEAIFAYATFHAFGDEVKTLEQDLRTEKSVLRSMIVIRGKTSGQGEHTGERPWQGARPASSEAKPASHPLSNEALEKKIEEILK
jgi:ribosomal protein S6